MSYSTCGRFEIIPLLDQPMKWFQISSNLAWVFCSASFHPIWMYHILSKIVLVCLSFAWGVDRWGRKILGKVQIVKIISAKCSKKFRISIPAEIPSLKGRAHETSTQLRPSKNYVMAREEEVHDFVTYYYVYFDGGGGYFIDLLFKGRCSILEIWVPYLVYIYYLMVKVKV